MAVSNKIADLDQLTSWLKTQDVRISRVIAARTSARALPAAMDVLGYDFGSVSGQDLLLACFRATLVAGVASTCPTQALKSVVAAADSAARSTSFAASRAAASTAPVARATATARAAARAARSARASSATTASTFTITASTFSFTTASAAEAAGFMDAENLRQGAPKDLFASPLWHSTDDIDQLLDFWETFAAHAAQPDHVETWEFWREWYQGVLHGVPVDWDLQLKVALIDDAIWEAGPKAVAKKIERIRAKFELEQEVAALKEQLRAQQQVVARTPQIGDNGGPPIDGPNAKAFKKDLVLIWSDIEELETELAKPEPSPGILKRLAQSLSETALRIAAYCGETVDLAVKDAARTIGKGAGGLIVAEYVKPGSIEAVAKAIGKFLTALAN